MMARDVINYLDANHIPTCSLVGFSMGGHAAMQTACSFPDRIEKLVVLDALPVDYKKTFPAVSLQITEFVSPTQLNYIAGLPLTSTTKEAVLEKIKPHSGTYFDLLAKNLEETEAGLRWKVAVESLLEGYSSLRDNHIQGEFAGPALVLLANESELTVKQLPILGPAEDLYAKHLKNCTVEYIDEVTHTLHLQKPRQVLRLISDFLIK
jgi:pimeloyl-ACP methyl ester carboxylesterase